MNSKFKKKKVVLGLSGGVDSAVSCYLLLKQGYDVIPVFMKNWDRLINHDEKGTKNKNFIDGCESNQDYEMAKKIAKHFNLKLHKVEFIEQYWQKVFKYFISQYKKSLTPNPDILCNKYIKFGDFKKYAEKKFKPDFIATGHYAKLRKKNNSVYLAIPKDKTKDQTYFLAYLNQKQLKNVLFPLANYTKKEVRQIAKKIKLPNWDRKDSMGICFIGKRDFQQFLNNYLPNKPGIIIDIKTNKVIGKHIGTMYYTLGQNKGLHLSGQQNKYFVCKKNVKKNIIYVCNAKNKNKYLLSTHTQLNGFNFINPTNKKEFKNLKVRFRHLQKLIIVKSMKLVDNKWTINHAPTLSITPGQYAVIYKNQVCLGCGEIAKSW